MITRETKIGLVVACSFLCLVAVVLVGKYTNLLGTPPPSDADQLVASDDKPGPEKEEENATDKKNPKPTPLEKLSPDATPSLEPAPPVVQAGGLDLEPLPPLPDPKSEAGARTEKTNLAKVEEKNQDPLPPREPKDESKVIKPAVPAEPTEIGSNGDTEKKPSEKIEKPAPMPDPTDAKKGGDDDLPLPPLPGEDPAKKSESKPPAEVTIELPPPPSLPNSKKPDSPIVRVPLVPEVKPEPADMALPEAGRKNSVPAIPLPADNLPPKSPSPAPVKNPTDAGLLDKAQVAMGKPVPGVPGESPRHAPGPGESPRPSTSTTGAPASRVPSRPAGGAAPRVESFDEEMYRPRQDDTFAAISKRYYQTDKYAQALLLFNREHPRAGDGVRRDPPILAGQPVYIPPIHVLEKRHGDAIEGYKPPPSNPTPVGRDVPATRANTASATGTVMYQVSPNGETMMEIARAKLGNGDRWPEIDKLNPGWRPYYPIPGGTTLRLPGDLRLSP